MSDESYITLLYHKLLGRAPDASGLAAFLSDVSQHGDIRRVIDAIVGSEEYRVKSGPSKRITSFAAASLTRPVTIVDVGAQMLETEGHIYQPLLDSGLDCACISFEPLEEKRLTLLRQNSPAVLKTFSDFVGDGSTRRFHINNDDATSSLYPLNVEFNRHYNHLKDIQTISTQEVSTSCLDDLLKDEEVVDFLKLDIQGFELAAIEGAKDVLRRTNIVHCEVEFGPIYHLQPLFSEVEKSLRDQGFAFIDFGASGRYHFCTVPYVTRSPERLLWADAIFARNLPNRADVRQDSLAQAIIMDLVYQKHGMAQHLLQVAGWSFEEVSGLFQADAE